MLLLTMKLNSMQSLLQDITLAEIVFTALVLVIAQIHPEHL